MDHGAWEGYDSIEEPNGTGYYWARRKRMDDHGGWTLQNFEIVEVKWFEMVGDACLTVVRMQDDSDGYPFDDFADWHGPLAAPLKR